MKELEVSFSGSVNGSEDLTLGDVLTDGIDQESVSVERIYCEEMLKRLDEILPLAREIGELRLQGKSDREIARILGVDRMTMLRMLERAKAVLKVEL
jgi:DNA-directed RNA polymerase specialized sigma subunit